MVNRKVIAAQNVSRMCIVCGVENAAGLKGRFYEVEGDELLGIFTPRVEHQGYPGRLHGGVASMVLDETMGRAVNLEDRDAWGVTLQLSVKYRKPVPLDQDIRVIARITKDSGRMFEGTGEIVLEDGTVAVEAHGKYLRLPIDRIVEGGFSSDWFADAREAPDEVEL
jgi:acyl-coenzyme A thioesterase PaaI-like protein